VDELNLFNAEHGCDLFGKHQKPTHALMLLVIARSELRKVLFLAPPVCEISREPLDGFASDSHGKRVWSLAQMSLKVKVKGQMSRSPVTKMAFVGSFGGLRACSLFCKTSLASS